MNRALFAAALTTALLATATDRAASQQVDAMLLPRTAGLRYVPAPPQVPDEGSMSAPLAPTAFSLLLPGAGQHMLGQRRKWVYAALEVVGWALFLERRSKGGEYRDRYRDFAWERGRIQSGPRLDGDFDYYETLSQWNASGGYDIDSGTMGVQPEDDPSTYNGSIWQRATQIFLPGGLPVPPSSPEYVAALDFYRDRAYGSAFLWDWSATQGGREELGDLIRASDDRFRQATTALGVVIANHLVSAVDAYLSARGRRAPLRLDLVPDAASGGPGWSAVLSMPWAP